MSNWVNTHRKAIAGYLGFIFGSLPVVGYHYHWDMWWYPLLLSGTAALGVHAVTNDTPVPTVQRDPLSMMHPPT